MNHSASNLSLRPLGECVRLVNGRAYSQEELLETGTPVIRIQNLNGGDRWYYSNLNLPEDKHCIDGDLLFAWSASFGPYIWSGPKSIYHYHIWKIIPLPGFDKNYLFHLLGWITESVKAASRGVAMLHMTKSGMEAWKVPAPPIEEQRRIAAILDQADALRAKRREALAELDGLAQAIFVEMFGDPSNKRNTWGFKKLSQACIAINDCPHSTPIWTEAGEICLRTSNLTKGGWDWSDKRFVSKETFLERSSRGAILPGDIILSREGTIGIAAIVPDELKACMGQRLVQVRPNGTILDSNYLLGHLLLILNPEKIKYALVGSTSHHLNVKELRDLNIPIPPFELQTQYSTHIQAVKALENSHRTALTELDALFASLQHRAFRGEL